MGANRRPARMDQALDGFASMDAYGTAVYARGTLMYEDLRERLGDRRFLAWLRTWAERHRFGVATPADWHRALAEALGQAGAEAFAARWIRADGLTPAVLRGPVTRQPAP